MYRPTTLRVFHAMDFNQRELRLCLFLCSLLCTTMNSTDIYVVVKNKNHNVMDWLWLCSLLLINVSIEYVSNYANWIAQFLQSLCDRELFCLLFFLSWLIFICLNQSFTIAFNVYKMQCVDDDDGDDDDDNEHGNANVDFMITCGGNGPWFVFLFAFVREGKFFEVNIRLVSVPKINWREELLENRAHIRNNRKLVGLIVGIKTICGRQITDF